MLSCEAVLRGEFIVLTSELISTFLGQYYPGGQIVNKAKGPRSTKSTLEIFKSQMGIFKRAGFLYHPQSYAYNY